MYIDFPEIRKQMFVEIGLVYYIYFPTELMFLH